VPQPFRFTIVAPAILLTALSQSPISWARPQLPSNEKTFAALVQKLAAELRGSNVKRVLVLDLGDPDDKVTSFGSWLADQIAVANTWAPIEVVDRQLLASYLDEHFPGRSELDPDAAEALESKFKAKVVTGSYSGAENGIGVTLVVGTKVKFGQKRSKEKPVIEKIALTDEMKSHLMVPLESLMPSDEIFDMVTGGISEPTCRSCKNPYYPENVARRGVQGVVVLSVVVTADGRASNVTIVKKLDRELDQEAVNVVRTWKFIPGVNVDGKPVAVRTPIEVSFRLF
jgi:TonB family protein